MEVNTFWNKFYCFSINSKRFPKGSNKWILFAPGKRLSALYSIFSFVKCSFKSSRFSTLIAGCAFLMVQILLQYQYANQFD